MIVPGWHDGLDDVVKIGWPWHGLLEDIGGGNARLTTPAGVVIDFPAGDMSHPISGAVAIGEWKNGRSTRYKIPGLPPASTPPDDAAGGMTWLNYFIESGIAKLGGVYAGVYIDSDGVPWRMLLGSPLDSGIPSVVYMRRRDGTNAAVVTIARPTFANDSPLHIAAPATQSSTGNLVVGNVFRTTMLNRPVMSWRLDITGSVGSGTVQAVMTKIVDNNNGITESTTTGGWTAEWQRHHVWQLYQCGDSCSYVPGYDTPGEDTSGVSSGPLGTGIKSHPYIGIFAHADNPGAKPPIPVDGNNYSWNAGAFGANTFAGGGYVGYTSVSVAETAFRECLGYFVGVDDGIKSAWAHSHRVDRTDAVQTFDLAMDISGVRRITVENWIVVGGYESERYETVVEVNTFANGVDDKVYGPPLPRFINMLRRGGRYVIQCAPFGESSQRYRVAVSESDAKQLFGYTFSISTWPPINPTVCASVNPATGAIAARSTDGRAVCWV